MTESVVFCASATAERLVSASAINLAVSSRSVKRGAWRLFVETGERCDVNIDDCQSLPCRNGAECVDLVASYHCRCAPGFHGVHCQLPSQYLIQYIR